MKLLTYDQLDKLNDQRLNATIKAGNACLGKLWTRYACDCCNEILSDDDRIAYEEACVPIKEHLTNARMIKHRRKCA